MFLFYLSVCIMLSPLGIYFYFFLKRILSLFNAENKKITKYVLAFLCTVILVYSSNPYGVGIVIMGHLIVYSLLMELIYFIFKKLKKDSRWVKIVYKSGVIPLLLTVVTLIFAYFNMLNVVVKYYDIKTDKNLNHDYKVVFISDLHFGTTMNNEKLKEYAQDIEDLNPSFVLLGGDIVDENTSKIEMIEVFNTLGSIKSEFGTFFVYGNHDKTKYFNNPHFSESELKEAIDSSNIIPLVDSTYEINDDLLIIGRDDLTFPSGTDKRKDSGLLISDDAKDKFLLIVDHHPSDLKINEQNGYDLQLSGHTHGGQIFPTGLVTEWFNGNNLNYGYKEIGKFKAIVSSGMGGWAYPFRTGNNSEYLVISISSSKKY